MRVESTQPRFDKKDIEEKSAKNPLYEHGIECENENENITFIKETNIYSPIHIKTIIKEKYKLNDLQAI